MRHVPLALDVQTLSPKELSNAGPAWQNLITQSQANRLFMSWPWLSAWWETWGATLDLEAIPLVVTANGRWVGCLPLYRFERRGLLGLRGNELHVMGNAWHIAPTVRTEYIDIVCVGSQRVAVERVLQEHLAAIDWDMFIFRDYAGAESAPAVFGGQHTLVPRGSEEGICIDTKGSFGDWLAKLGPATRLKVYNRRDYLAKHHAVRFEQLEDPELGFHWLNLFHRKRWGTACFEGRALEFHKRFLARLDYFQSARFTTLVIDGQVVSVLYDVKAGNVVYNLQAGFLEEYDRKVSLGTLHLGYAIERAFLDPAVHTYDLLAGGGKNSFYKKHFRGRRVTFRTGQLVRNPWLRAVYGSYLVLPDRFRRPILKVLRRIVAG